MGKERSPPLLLCDVTEEGSEGETNTDMLMAGGWHHISSIKMWNNSTVLGFGQQWEAKHWPCSFWLLGKEQEEAAWRQQLGLCITKRLSPACVEWASSVTTSPRLPYWFKAKGTARNHLQLNSQLVETLHFIYKVLKSNKSVQSFLFCPFLLRYVTGHSLKAPQCCSR